jgi:hypothetical protein
MAYVVDERLKVETTTYTSLRFRAIFAGWLIATGFAGLFYVAGLALGFSSFEAWNAAESARGIGIGTGVWMFITWAASLFLGGMFASWFDGGEDDTDGALHGATVWGLSVVTTALFLALGLGHGIPEHRGGMGEMRGGPDNGGIHTSVPAVALLEANIAFQLPGHDRSSAAPIVASLIADKEDVAAALLGAETGTTAAAAAGTLAHLQPEIQAAQRQSKEAADRATHYLALTLWSVFFSAFGGLLSAALGGWLGASHIHRVYHLRTYSRRVRS